MTQTYRRILVPRQRRLRWLRWRLRRLRRRLLRRMRRMRWWMRCLADVRAAKWDTDGYCSRTAYMYIIQPFMEVSWGYDRDMIGIWNIVGIEWGYCIRLIVQNGDKAWKIASQCLGMPWHTHRCGHAMSRSRSPLKLIIPSETLGW